MKRKSTAAADKEAWSKFWPSQDPDRSVPLLHALHILTLDGALLLGPLRVAQTPALF